jgi:hypothetical protein
MKYIINGKNFESKKKITEYFASILNSREVSKPLNDSDFKDVSELLKYHIEYGKKVGAGIESISIEYHRDDLTNKLAKYPHFQINRVDGSVVDFSYHKTIGYINSGKTVGSENSIDVKKAMRFIVKSQINEFRDKIFSKKTYLRCPILDINFSKKTCHIDHTPPLSFDVLVFNFLKENNINFNDIELLDINGIFSTFKCAELKNKWFEYHKTNAILRGTHSAGNLSQKREKIEWDLIGEQKLK